MLRLFNVANLDRTHVFEFVLEHIGGTLGHVLVNFGGNFVVGRLHCKGKLLGVDFAQDNLHGTVVQQNNILEDEHELLDFLGKFGVVDFKRFNDGAFSCTVDTVKNFNNGLDTARACEVLH